MWYRLHPARYSAPEASRALLAVEAEIGAVATVGLVLDLRRVAQNYDTHEEGLTRVIASGRASLLPADDWSRGRRQGKAITHQQSTPLRMRGRSMAPSRQTLPRTPLRQTK